MILLKTKSKNDEKISDITLNHQNDLPCQCSIEQSEILGHVLKIHTVPRKTCPGDCLYCPYGKTAIKTIERDIYYSLKGTTIQLAKLFSENSQIDYIVITGYGETALDADLQWLIGAIRKLSSKPIAIESCGSLMWRSSVKRDMLKADSVFVNIDSADKQIYHQVNRYHQLIPYLRYMEGLMDFRSSYKGNFFINVYLLNGFNSQEPYLAKLSSLIKKFEPAKILLHTTTNEIDKKQKLSVTDDYLKMSLRYFGPAALVCK